MQDIIKRGMLYVFILGTLFAVGWGISSGHVRYRIEFTNEPSLEEHAEAIADMMPQGHPRPEHKPKEGK